MFCLDWRTERDGEKVDEALYDEVADWRSADRLTDVSGWRPSTPSGSRSTT